MSHLTHEIATQTGRLTILRDVSFDIGAGEKLCIVGRSGSGKTSLLELLALLTKPPAGSVFLDGDDISRFTESRRVSLRRTKMGFVFQSFNLIDHLTALENVELAMRYAGRVSRATAMARLDSVGLSAKARTIASALSGGEKQRVAIARATVNDPDILFADEPTGSLDVETGETVLQALMATGQPQRTLVMVTHSPEVAALFPRQLHLNAGALGA